MPEGEAALFVFPSEPARDRVVAGEGRNRFWGGTRRICGWLCDRKEGQED